MLKRNLLGLINILMMSLSFWGNTAQAKGPIVPRTLSVMSYNAENFYDELHDKGTTDYTYLPLAVKRASQEAMDYCNSLSTTTYRENCLNFDWTLEAVEKKVSQLGKVIQGSIVGGPDFIVMQEVENLRVLTMLRDKGLKGMGYQTVVLFDGQDTRGIDVGIIGRFPLMKPAIYHPVDLEGRAPGDSRGSKPTRGILEVTFDVGGKPLTVLANHWPSQRNPDWQRVVAAKTMIEIALQADGPVIMAGDFNTMDSDNPNAIIQEVVAMNAPMPSFDAEKVHFGEQLYETALNPEMIAPHRGTHFFDGKWSSLDRIFIPRSHVAAQHLQVDWDSYHVVKLPLQVHDVTHRNRQGKPVVYRGVPKSFDPKTGTGASDHLPIVLTFALE